MIRLRSWQTMEIGVHKSLVHSPWTPFNLCGLFVVGFLITDGTGCLTVDPCGIFLNTCWQQPRSQVKTKVLQRYFSRALKNCMEPEVLRLHRNSILFNELQWIVFFPIKFYFRRKIPVIVLKTCEVGCFHHRPSLSSLQNSRILVELVLFLKVRRFCLEFRAGICGSLHFIILTSTHTNKQRPINVHFVRWFSRSKVKSAQGCHYLHVFFKMFGKWWPMVTTGDLVFRLTLPGIWCLQATENDTCFFFWTCIDWICLMCLLTQVLIHSEFYDHEGWLLNLQTAQVGQNSLETENSPIPNVQLAFLKLLQQNVWHMTKYKNTLGCRCIGECTWSCICYICCI